MKTTITAWHKFGIIPRCIGWRRGLDLARRCNPRGTACSTTFSVPDAMVSDSGNRKLAKNHWDFILDFPCHLLYKEYISNPKESMLLFSVFGNRQPSNSSHGKECSSFCTQPLVSWGNFCRESYQLLCSHSSCRESNQFLKTTGYFRIFWHLLGAIFLNQILFF